MAWRRDARKGRLSDKAIETIETQRTERTRSRWNNARPPLVALAGGGTVSYSVTVFETEAINLFAFALLFIVSVGGGL